MEGLSWFVHVVGQLLGQAAGGLWEQLDKERFWHPVITAILISVPLNRTAVCTSHTYSSKCHRTIMLQTFNQVGRNCKSSIDNI